MKASSESDFEALIYLLRKLVWNKSTVNPSLTEQASVKPSL
ncbi:MAG: hypothetical protein OXC05_05270 [Halieaceae bacterium]|nr:hypothetical protein [Halieaceae bacterium]